MERLLVGWLVPVLSTPRKPQQEGPGPECSRMASSCRTVVFNSVQYACGEVGVGVGHVQRSRIFLEGHGVGFLGALTAPGFSALSRYLMRLSD